MTEADEEIEEQLEQKYVDGSRYAWRQMLALCMDRLQMTGKTVEGLVLEREDTIAALRSVCADFGDNDWSASLSLADVVEKHLARPLHQAELEDEDDEG